MPTFLVDFHCHLDLYPDPAAAMASCDQHHVYALTVTTTPRAWPRNCELASKTAHVHPALGLHPQLVAERSGEIALWEEYLPQTRYVGEVGLDAGPRHYHSLDPQKDIFERVLKACANSGGKILSVHSVRAGKLVLDLIEAHLPSDRGRVVLHWFTGSAADARRAVDLGCFFSINTAMLASDRSRNLVATLPLNRLLTETDGPFVQVDGRPTRPEDVASTVRLLAQSRQMSVEETAQAIQANLRELISDAG